MIDDDPWFVVVDVCFALGYSHTPSAVRDVTEPHHRNTVRVAHGNRGNPNRLAVSEGGLYALIMGSKLPAARRFKTWVTDVVLPAIRKDGAYVAGEEKVATGEMSPDDLIRRGYEAQGGLLAGGPKRGGTM